METFRPLHDRVLVRPDTADEKTAGGILIPETAQKKPAVGTVIAVGPGTAKKPMELQVGKKVKYSRWAGTEIEIDGSKHLVMREEEVPYVLY